MKRPFTKENILIFNEHMKRFSTSLIMKAIQIKTIMILEWLKLKRLTIPNVDKNVEQECGELSCSANRNVKWNNHFENLFGSF